MLFRPVKKLNEKFGAKFFLSFSLIVVVASISFTAFFIRHQSNSMKENLVREGQLLSRMLAYNSRLGVFSENELLLKDAVEGILQHQDVKQVSVFLPDGTLLSIQEKNENGAKQKEPARTEEHQTKAAELLKDTFESFYKESADHFDFWTPVLSVSDYADAHLSNPAEASQYVIGFVKVSIDKRALKEKSRNLLFNSTLIALVFLIVSAVAIYLAIAGIVRPLNRLTAGVKALETGTHFEQVPVETRDEIGKLATAFNNLAETLRKREAEKQQLEEQLRHAQKMEAIGTLAGGVAHDFNNFLTAIIGYGNLLQMGIPKSDKMRLYVDQVMTAAERAANLTQRLLTFGRKQIMNLKPVYLNDIFKSIDKLLAQLIGEDIEFKIGPVPPKTIIMADSGQIDQVLINLATNARDAMPQGGKLLITTETAEITQDVASRYESVRPGKYARITVADSGIGLDVKTKERIFDPFFTTKEVGKGTGLGLSVVYGIIKQHNGFIEVDSRPGEGAKFCIYLPMIETVVEPIKTESPVLPRGNGETVLVAEDDAIVRSFTRELLEQYGYLVVEAVDGDDAVKKFMNHKDQVAVLLLDVIMPKMNGKDVFEEIKIVRPEMKALFISGYTYSVISRKGIMEKEINLLTKPVQPSELLSKLHDILNT